jgi:hypothetical protein
MSNSHYLSSKQKAFQINLDDTIYGTFAEIGAGQEVARNFFQAGGAAGTVAKSMSAYDMVVSDAIYGKDESGRYVSESRMQKMLDKEYEILVERLKEERSSETRFFVLANTVAAKSYKGSRDCHGWVGVKFQDRPGEEPSNVVIHIRMKDRENLQQQEVLGSIGVNLIYGCFYHLKKPTEFVKSLMENLSRERVEIDMIRVSGPAFQGVDSRLLSLELVKNGFTDVAYFDEKGRVGQASDVMYKKNIAIARGSYRPPTKFNMDMLKSGLAAFEKDIGDNKNTLLLPEISMSKLLERGGVNNEDFLARVDLLAKLGQKVLISNFENSHSLNKYLIGKTTGKIAFILGVYNLEHILNYEGPENEKYGLVGRLGRLLGSRTKLYVYPATELDQGSAQANQLVTSDHINIDENKKILLQFLQKNHHLEDIRDFDINVTAIWSRKVLKMIQEGDLEFEKMVPDVVSKIVKEKKLFDFNK